MSGASAHLRFYSTQAKAGLASKSLLLEGPSPLPPPALWEDEQHPVRVNGKEQVMTFFRVLSPIWAPSRHSLRG